LKIADVKQAILEGKYDKTFAYLYPDSIENVRQRYIKACDNFLNFIKKLAEKSENTLQIKISFFIRIVFV
jgi:hypothetical protein